MSEPMPFAAWVDPAREIASRLRRLQRAGRHPLERDEPIRPFFIVGSGRSGTTLLRRVLQACPELQLPPEMPALGEAIRLYRRNRALPWPELVRTTLGAFAFQPDFERFGVPLGKLADALVATPPRARSLARILDALYRAHARDEPRWGDKTPLNVFALEPIRAVFPRARFVHLLRDGVDVAHSYVAAGLQPDAVTAARRWADSVAAARHFARRRPARCFELRYESLARRPAAVLPDLFSFLDLPWSPERLRAVPSAELRDTAHYPHQKSVLRPIVRHRIGAGRRALPAASLVAIERAIGAELSRAGYPPATCLR